MKTKYAKRKAKGIRTLVNTIAVLLFILLIILAHHLCDWLTEPKGCVVTNAEYNRNLSCWEITIRNDGQLWSYYGDYQTEGSRVYPIWDGDKIVDIK